MATNTLATTLNEAKAMMAQGRDVPWLLESATTQSADKTFLIWEPFSGDAATWTYAEFRRDVRRTAAGLAANGIERGQRVLIHLDNSPEFMLAWFACAELGVVAVSTNTRSVARDIEYFADHVAAVAAITAPKYAALVAASAPAIKTLVITDNDAGEPASPPAIEREYVAFNDLWQHGDDPPARRADATEDLGIQFTSGTTSRPKAVLWTHANAIFGAEVSAEHMRLRPDDVCQIFLPLFHTNAQAYSMLTTMWIGGSVVLQPRFSGSRFWGPARKHGATWCSTIPFCVKALLEGEVPTDHSFRFWGTAVVLPEVEQALGIYTLGWWGMTETITHGIVTRPEHRGARMSIGRPSPAFDIRVLHPDGTPIGPGQRGELFIRGVRGVQLFKEYFNNDAANQAAFDDDGWFATGDLIAMDESGEMFFSDRAKDMLKVGAENVAASEIESIVAATGLVTENAVVGQPHSMLDEVPVVFAIAADPNASGVEAAIIAACRAQLADFKVPRAVYLVDELPRATLEKVAKAELRKRLPTLQA